jgi:molybdate transport system permease protein
MGELGTSLLLSLRVAISATVLCALIGTPLAFAMSRVRFGGKSVVEALITVPLILPPTVVGYLVLVAAGAQSPLGAWLRETLGVSIVFSATGAIVASTIVALPLLYMPARAAFVSVDRELEDASRLMGANLLQMFWHVSLPLARRGITSGLLLSFARALGEFGATVMIFGTGPGPRPLPISIYLDYETGQMAHASAAVLMLTAASMLVILIYNRSTLSRQD